MIRQCAVGLSRRLVLGAISVLAAIGAALPAAAATQESSQHTLGVTYTSELGEFLTDSRGMSLYLYTKDQPGVSNCYGSCANIWPPLLVVRGEPSAPPALPGKLGLTTRTDGAKQVTYNGIPLYYWVGDKKAGDTNGQGVDDEWFVVKP